MEIKNLGEKKIGYEVLSKSMDFIEKKFRIENFIISVTRFNKNAKKLYYKLGFRNYKFKNGKIFLIKKCLSSKIVIGAANFGNYYGKRRTYINKSKAKAILQFAYLSGINLIDTASVYGKSEYILGLNDIQNFEIISKLPETKNKINCEKFIKKALIQHFIKLPKNIYMVT